jgi:hypothetical protein
MNKRKEQPNAETAARAILVKLQQSALACEGIGGNSCEVTGAATELMRALDASLNLGPKETKKASSKIKPNAALADIAQQAADTVEPLGLTQIARRFDIMRQIAAGERAPESRAI